MPVVAILVLAACSGTPSSAPPTQSAPPPPASPQAAPVPTANPTSTPAVTRPAAASPAPSPTVDSGPAALQRLRVGNTGGSGANLRREPSAQSERVELVPDGALVDLVDPGREVGGAMWREVRTDSGATGWISAEFLSPVTAVEIRVSPLPIQSGGPPSSTVDTGARVPPVDANNCPESHPVKAVGVGGLRYVPPGHPQYAGTAPDICFSSVEAAEALGFRAP